MHFPIAPAEADQKNSTGKFVFPGTLRLDMKRLRKGIHQQEYQTMYNLRYQVYCHEAHFLSPDNYPSGQEMDEFDDVSEHFLATNPDKNDEMVGTVRLVRWSEDLSFPTAHHYQPLVEQLDYLDFPLHSTAEISRLSISKQYRKRAKDGLLGAEGYENNGDPRRKYPEIILELFKIMYQASKNELGITHWIATFENCLYRLLSRYGVRFEQITSDDIEYYGKVKIYGASVAYIEEAVRALKPELYAYFCAGPVSCEAQAS